MDIAEDLGVSVHMYADDTQLYCSPRETIAAVSRLELCIAGVDRCRIAASWLKLTRRNLRSFGSAL